MTETMTSISKIRADIEQILELLEDVTKNVDTHRDVDHAMQRELSDKVKDLYHITVGMDGKNGLRSRVENLERRHDNVDPQEIKRQLEGQEKWRYQTMAIFALLQVFLVPLILAFLLKFIK